MLEMNRSEHDNLGAGGYGFVISPALQNNINGVATNFPDNVTKIFYRKDDYDKVINKIPKLTELFGFNEGHRMNPYKRSYNASILDPSIRSTYHLSESDPLYLIRMPNLGKNLSNVSTYVESVRRINIINIIYQIQKLINQVYNLSLAGYIHGDIRQENIMFNPKNGILTIIDFDLMYPLKRFDEKFTYNYGYYSHPPESVVIFNKIYPRFRKTIDEYAYYNFRSFENYYHAVGVKNVEDFKIKLNEANKDNQRYIESIFDPSDPAYNPRKIASQLMLPSLDGYGLSITLLEFLTVVYGPQCTGLDRSEKSVEILKNALVSKLATIDGVSYKSGELELFARVLLQIVNLVLRPLARGRLTERITPLEAKTRMDKIVDDTLFEYGKLTYTGGNRRTYKNSVKLRNKRKKTYRKSRQI
jgi:serine/threonine protein kinase